MADIGMLIAPIRTLSNQSCQFRGTVLAKVPRNSTMMIWNATVEKIIPTNIQLLNMPLNTFIFSISRLFISLKTCQKRDQRKTIKTIHSIICILILSWVFGHDRSSYSIGQQKRHEQVIRLFSQQVLLVTMSRIWEVFSSSIFIRPVYVFTFYSNILNYIILKSFDILIIYKKLSFENEKIKHCIQTYCWFITLMSNC